jgi:flagellar biosynthesis chaperone FliJ
MQAVTMQEEMRDISGDLRERADLIVGQMVAEQTRYRQQLAQLNEERATRRQQLETARQSIHRFINVLTVQHVLHRALKSAVTALDAQAEKSEKSPSKGKGRG